MRGLWLAVAFLGCVACGENSVRGHSQMDSGNSETPDAGALDVAGDTTDAASTVDQETTPDLAEMTPDAAPDLTLPPDMVVEPDVPPMPTIGELCFSDRAPQGGAFDGPNYDQFAPRVGAHCFGTNHQHIFGIEEVVFLGDSVTVGTPPTLSGDFYRSKLADTLATRFHLEEPGYFWKVYNPTSGTSAELESGSFRNCSKWGARTDDLLKGGEQIAKCFPDGGSTKRTLVVMTIGGNDISEITKAGGTEGRPITEVEAMTQQAVADLEEAMLWLKDPVRFPNGSFVVFANPFEFTDGTGKTEACAAANLADLEAWDDPDELARLVIWLNEQFMRIAVDTGTDMVFMLEHFCGHGWVATGPNADTQARCYLGPDTQRWFDDSCIHPNPTGHGVIAEMFMAVVDEVGSAP